jgi:hypothetical protein
MKASKVSTRKKFVAGQKKGLKIFFLEVEITPLMSFKLLKIKLLKITLKVKVIKFSKLDKKFPKKLKLLGGYPSHVKFMLGINPQLYETLAGMFQF